MTIRSIFTHPRFDKAYRALPKNIQCKAERQEEIFREDPFNYQYRIKFIFLNEAEVLFLDIGGHEIYK